LLVIVVDIAALKIHLSENAHEAIKEFPEFITECRGEICVKVGLVYLHSVFAYVTYITYCS